MEATEAPVDDLKQMWTLPFVQPEYVAVSVPPAGRVVGVTATVICA
jgi:hypothetical protein